MTVAAIHTLGRVYPESVGVRIGQSGGSTVAHNHIYDLYYSAISVGWTWQYALNLAGGNHIEYNHLHDLGKGVMSDMGAIYTLGQQPGTVLRNNLIHDIECFVYGGWDIYMDQASSNILIENNIVHNARRSGGLRMGRNLYWDTRGGKIRPAGKTWEEWQKTGQDTDSLVADPLFVNPDNYNFTLRPESPARKLGFRPIDLSSVGPREPAGPVLKRP